MTGYTVVMDSGDEVYMERASWHNVNGWVIEFYDVAGAGRDSLVAAFNVNVLRAFYRGTKQPWPNET